MEGNECEECERTMKRKMSRDCKECGAGVEEGDDQFSMIGMDAVALFPSLSGKITAKLVRKRVEESKISWHGFNWKKATIYLLSNKHLVEKIEKEVKRYFPVRKKSGGVQPGLTSKGMNNKEDSEEEQWYFPRKNPSKEVN